MNVLEIEREAWAKDKESNRLGLCIGHLSPTLGV